MFKILLIEDDEEIRLHIAKYLRKNLFYVYEFSDGEDILFRVSECQPDLIVCDIMLPIMDGVSILKLLKKSKYSIIPVIMLTAICDYNNARICNELGSVDYIYKPFKNAGLLKSINTQKEIVLSFRDLNQNLNGLKKSIEIILGHEFRTPIHGILNTCYLIYKDDLIQSKPAFKDLFKYLQSSAERLNRSIYRLLLFFDDFSNSSITNKYIDNYICLFDYQNHVNIQNIINVIKDNNKWLGTLTLNFSVQDKIVIPKLYLLCFYEILDNAIKFSELNDNVECHIWNDDKYIFTKVSDKGTRINVHTINTYKPFTQFDRNKFEQQGLGLGIFLAQKSLRILNSINLEYFDNTPSGITCVFKHEYEQTNYLFN